jgi:hypothetical protein
VVDHQFANAHIAALYDIFHPRRPSPDFYLPHIMSAESVLDVGCAPARCPSWRGTRVMPAGCGLDPRFTPTGLEIITVAQ